MQLSPANLPRLQSAEPHSRRATARTMLSHAQLLLSIIALAVALRVASAIFQGNSLDTLPGIHDQISYDELARRVLTGHGFSFATDHWPATRAGEPTAHWSYLYTLYLSAVYFVFGTTPIVARVLQAAIVGVLHTWLAWRIGNRIFGAQSGYLTALLSSVYIYFIYYTGALITESFYIVGILWTIDAALRIAGHQNQNARQDSTDAFPTWPAWLELGIAIGVTVLLRQIFLLLVPFILLWLWIDLKQTAATRSPIWAMSRHHLAGFVLVIATVTCLILPWSIRNYYVFGRIVPLNTNAGFAFYWGNHPYYGSTFPGVLPEGGPTYQDLLPPGLGDLNEAELDSALLARGLGFVADDPIRYIRLSLSRSVEYFKFWPTAESSLISNISRTASFGIALPFILFGLVRAAVFMRRTSDRAARSAIALLVIMVAVYTAIHLLVWALIRYRVPVDALLLIFAAYGLQQLVTLRGTTHVARQVDVPHPSQPDPVFDGNSLHNTTQQQ